MEPKAPQSLPQELAEKAARRAALRLVDHIIQLVKKGKECDARGIVESLHDVNLNNQDVLVTEIDELRIRLKIGFYSERFWLPYKEKWASVFVDAVFTAGARSTQRSEAMNATIGRTIDSKSFISKLPSFMMKEAKKLEISLTQDLDKSLKTKISGNFSPEHEWLDTLINKIHPKIFAQVKREIMLAFDGYYHVKDDSINEDEMTAIVVRENIFRKVNIRLGKCSCR